MAIVSVGGDLARRFFLVYFSAIGLKIGKYWDEEGGFS